MSKRLSFRVQVTSPLGEVLVTERVSVGDSFYPLLKRVHMLNLHCNALRCKLTVAHDICATSFFHGHQFHNWLSANFGYEVNAMDCAMFNMLDNSGHDYTKSNTSVLNLVK